MEKIYMEIKIDKNLVGLNKPTSQKKPEFFLFYLLGIFFVIVMIFFIFASTKTIMENIEVSYSEQETYNVTEPHQITESYTDYYESGRSSLTLPRGSVITDCGKCECHEWRHLAMIFEGPGIYCDYCLCPYEAERTVTKYLEIPKIRNVTKTRIESQPTEVNWIFGYKTPYALHLPFIS